MPNPSFTLGYEIIEQRGLHLCPDYSGAGCRSAVIFCPSQKVLAHWHTGLHLCLRENAGTTRNGRLRSECDRQMGREWKRKIEREKWGGRDRERKRNPWAHLCQLISVVWNRLLINPIVYPAQQFHLARRPSSKHSKTYCTSRELCHVRHVLLLRLEAIVSWLGTSPLHLTLTKQSALGSPLCTPY